MATPTELEVIEERIRALLKLLEPQDAEALLLALLREFREAAA